MSDDLNCQEIAIRLDSLMAVLGSSDRAGMMQVGIDNLVAAAVDPETVSNQGI